MAVHSSPPCTHNRLCTVGGDRPFLLSGADDKLVKVWDYQTKVRGLQERKDS